MNPFIVFLILLPLIVALLLWVGAILWTIEYGLSGSAIAMNAIFGGLFIALIYLLLRSSKSAWFDDTQIQHLDLSSRKRLTNSLLGVTYFVVFMLLVVVLNFYTIRHWIGIASIIMAMSLLLSAFGELRRSKKISPQGRASISEAELETRHLGVGNKGTRNLVIISSVVAVLLNSLLFFGFDGNRIISSIDFIGLFILWGSVVFWFVSK